MNRLTDPHAPDDACKVGDLDHCDAHAVDEPLGSDPFRVCGECFHVFPTVDALLADHAALVERLNGEQLPFTPYAPPLVAKTDPAQITCCPHCAHDW